MKNNSETDRDNIEQIVPQGLTSNDCSDASLLTARLSLVLLLLEILLLVCE